MINNHDGDIYILATGGTIAGASVTSLSNSYTPGALNIEQLIESIPEISKLNVNQYADDVLKVKNSCDITVQDWIVLAKKVNDLLDADNVKGIVITHGTDALEETAYFLHLVIKSDKPVVLVGSLRAATSLSPDGPLNLYNAIQVIQSPASVGRGVMVVMNDTIFDGRDVTKVHTTMVNAFNAPNTGAIGNVAYGNVDYERYVARKHTIDTPFKMQDIDDLPDVEILYDYAANNGQAFAAMIDRHPKGIVVAGMGGGSISAANRSLLKMARDAGIVIVRCSRTGGGKVIYNNLYDLDSELGLVAASNLNPQKARILLMLMLQYTTNPNNIQQAFYTY